MKYFFLSCIILITTILCLWSDLDFVDFGVSEHHWSIDLIMHGGYFFVAMFVLLLLRFKPPILYQGIALFVLSVVLELLQYFSGTRSVDIIDIASNLVGIVAGLVAFVVYDKYKSNRFK